MNHNNRRLNLSTDRYSEFVPLSTEGAGGEVFRAKDSQVPLGFPEWVVIKRPKWDQLESGDLQKRLIEKEIRALRRLAAVSGVCRLRDCGEATYLVNQGQSSIPYTYLVMEIARGKDIRSIVERAIGQDTPLPPGLCLRVLLFFAETLAEAHRHGVIYNDFKPEHLFWESETQLTVIDWGMADFLSTAGQNPDSGGQPPNTERDKAHIRDEIRKFGDLMFFILTGDSAETHRQQEGNDNANADGLLRAVHDPGMRQVLRHIYQPQSTGLHFLQMEDVVDALQDRLLALEKRLAPYGNQIEALLKRRSSPASVKSIELLMGKVKEVDPDSPQLEVWALRLHEIRHEQELQDQIVLWQLYVCTQDWQSAARACEQGLTLVPQWELGHTLLTITNALSSLTESSEEDERLLAIGQALSEGDYDEALSHTIRLDTGDPDGQRWKQIAELCATFLVLLSLPRPRLQQLVRVANELIATLNTAWSENGTGKMSLTNPPGPAQEIGIIANAFTSVAVNLWDSQSPRLDHRDVMGEYQRLENQAEQLGYLLSESANAIPSSARQSAVELRETLRKIRTVSGAISTRLDKIEAFGNDTTFEHVATALWQACAYDIDGFALRKLARRFESQPTAFLPTPPPSPASATVSEPENSTWLMDGEESRSSSLDGFTNVQQRLHEFGRTFEQVLRTPKDTMFDTDAQSSDGSELEEEEDRHPTFIGSVEPDSSTPFSDTAEIASLHDTEDETDLGQTKDHFEQHSESSTLEEEKPRRLLHDLAPPSALEDDRYDRVDGEAEPTKNPGRQPSQQSVIQRPEPSTYSSLVVIEGSRIGHTALAHTESQPHESAGFFVANDGTLYIRQTNSGANNGEGLIITLDDILAMRKPPWRVGRLVRLLVTWEVLEITDDALVGLIFSTTDVESFLLAVQARSEMEGDLVLLNPRRKDTGIIPFDSDSIALQQPHTFQLEYTYSDEDHRDQAKVYVDSTTHETAVLWAQRHQPQTALFVQGDNIHVNINRLEVTFEPEQ